ncbi:MAG: tRNA uridine-5-carboxymethylaminomethyl(34) synthesis GTPase MnmE [Dorea sp.]|nr:tRNA uridine-5-carboxymethylaminomethyl(34) synthesis GTPase MnmE [Dorea sp.]
MNGQYSDTIAAISTALGSSGIGIVRMTGEEAFDIADKVYVGKKNKRLAKQKSHTIHYGYIEDEGRTIDEVLVMLMKGPRSYTGEDTVEINCHGGVYVVKKVLEVLIKNGARPADPGEFTKRAYLNGRLDLSQAEAVGDLISSQNEYARQSSVSQLKGSIKKKIDEIRKEIIYHTAFIETALDDPEHISVDGYGEKLKESVDKLLSEIQRLLSTCEDGRIIKEGIQTAIVGKPNAGKSSLLNAFLREERAIVTDIAGTTRDVLEEHINLQGISLNIMDTAGIHSTEDVVERIGVNRARSIIDKADLILFVMDASCPLDDNDRDILEMIHKKKSLILLNKSDLDQIITKEDVVNELELAKNSKSSIKSELNYAKKSAIIEISAKEQKGIDRLEEKIKEMFFEGEISFNDEIYITNVRHKVALISAYESLSKVNESIEMNMPEDFYSIDLMDAYESLGNITGETIGEDLVNEIFSKFCMGK